MSRIAPAGDLDLDGATDLLIGGPSSSLNVLIVPGSDGELIFPPILGSCAESETSTETGIPISARESLTSRRDHSCLLRREP
jgi:hypothetical protein